MITGIQDEKCRVIYCLSSDEKPTEDIGNGSQLYEIDTSKLYLFDKENKQWIQQESNELEAWARGMQ